MKYLLLVIILSSTTLIEAQLVDLSDEFQNPCALYEWTDISDYEGWNATHLEVKDVDISNDGQLTMMPYTTAWYQNYRSTLLYKEVTGDFVITSEVTISNRADDGNLPSRTYSLAGIMIRTPKDTLAANSWMAGEENYVFLSLGYAAENHPSCSGCLGPHFEVKTTTNSNTNLRVDSIGVFTVTMRIIRVNNAILVLYKKPGEEFIVHQRYLRADMPSTVQVGFVTYTDWPNVSGQDPFTHNSNNHSGPGFQPDLIGRFEYGRFTEIDLPPWLVTANFHIASQVPNDSILEYFDYESEYTGRAGWKIWKGTADNDWTNALNWSGGLLPTTADSILIPNCDCPEVEFPVIASGLHSIKSLVIEQGGELTLSSAAALAVDLDSSSSILLNDGIISNEGVFSVMNIGGKSVSNTGVINCIGSGVYNFEE